MTQTLTTNPPKPFKRLYSLEEFFKMSEAELFKDQRVETQLEFPDAEIRWW